MTPLDPKHKSSVRREATPNNARSVRSDKNLSRLVGTALAQCLVESGTSVRAAAKYMRCSRSTVERWKRDGFVIPPLRSKKLALCFAKNLHLLVAIRNVRTG